MVKVLSIVGYTRSGSTLLDAVLGQLEGFFSTGELHYLWERGLIEGRRCGCGEPIRACPVWSRVLDEVNPSGDPDPRRVVGWQERTVRTRHTPELLAGRAAVLVDRDALRSYRQLMSKLYASIADVTGAKVVVDSSKRPSDGAITRLLPGVDPYFVHLVRDPRAVVYSWRRRKQELDSAEGTDMPQQSVAASLVGWIELNLASDALRRAAGRGRSLLIRYEDFIHRPREIVEQIMRLVGEAPATLPFQSERSVDLSSNHTVSGNPSRFSTGVVELRPDLEWRSMMPIRDRRLVTAVALPLMAHYGYPVSIKDSERG